MEFTLDQDIIDLLGCRQVVDVRSELPVNPNYTWAQLAGVRSVDALTTIVYHHDALVSWRTSTQSDAQLMSNIAKSHIALKSNDPKGDAGFPYHIWIRNGTAYYCNTLTDRTYGVASNNGYTVHVCVSGDYTQDKLSDADRALLQAVSIQLSRQLPKCSAIKAHGELNPTACPAYDYANIRSEVETLKHRLAQANQWDAQLVEVSKLTNQIAYMTTLLSAGESDGNAQWAKNWLLDVAKIMKERKLM
jgi:hypothetical protein